jgi:Tfp pilus assembly major pilin PilA
MKKSIIISTLLALVASANEYLPNDKCKSCHNNIYKEFTKSRHANSTLDKDKIHSAIWQNHPAKDKGYDKSCAKCHNPTGDSHEAISCAYCHRIESIQSGTHSNSNIMSNTLKSYYGNREDKSNSPYHTIVTTNKDYKNANICLGCHSHKKNNNSLTVCQTESHNSDKQNCITCHMPQVNGTRADDIKTQTHSFHGFAGVSNASKMMTKYISLKAKRADDNLIVSITNDSPHSFLVQPLRVGVIKVTVYKGSTKFIKQKYIRKVFSDGKNIVSTAYAKEIVEDTTIAPNSTKDYKFENIRNGTKTKVTLGYYLIDPKSIEKLNLKRDYKSRKFYKLKEIDVK